MNVPWKKPFVLLLAAMLLCMASCGKTADPDPASYDFAVSYEGIKKGVIPAHAAVHDPSILKADGTYYIYGSHMSAAKCQDLMTWEKVADGYSPSNSIYGQIYSVGKDAFAYAGNSFSAVPTDDGGCHVWAPDVIYNKAQGKYFMYYCTTSTWCASNLCYGVSDSPEGPFQWQGGLIYSGFSADTIGETNVLDVVSQEYVDEHYYQRDGSYNFEECPNAIDPSVFYDAEGRMWMVYGSWSGGIFLLELDPQTGLVLHPEADPEHEVDPYFGKRLIGGGHKSIEGPYILYANGYYYLFVSYGALNRAGGYQIRVYRSQTPDGEYVDMNDHKAQAGFNHSFYGLKLSGNYDLPSLARSYMATGHNSALADDDGKLYIVHHTRFDNGSENHSPRVHQFLVNKEGWPCMLPYQTQGETVSPSGYAREQVTGRYYVINQGTGIDDKLARPVILYLNPSGSVAGENTSGSWTMEDGSYYMTVTIGDKTYSGVFCAMPDEAGAPTMTFSAVGKNESVWGVMYPDGGADETK